MRVGVRAGDNGQGPLLGMSEVMRGEQRFKRLAIVRGKKCEALALRVRMAGSRLAGRRACVG